MLGLSAAQYSMASDSIDDYASANEFELNDILQFAASTVVDIAVTAADSLTLGNFELNTRDALYGMGAGMGLGEYYDQHKEGINLASFVGGIVVPGMAVGKALKIARNMNNPFGYLEHGKMAWKAEALLKAKRAGAATDDVAAALRNARLYTAGGAVAEASLYELGFALFMNQHAYMDNSYGLEDAAIGVALGSIAIPLRIMGVNRDVRKGLQQIESKQMEKLVLPARYGSLETSDQLAVLSQRMKEIDEVPLDKLNSQGTNTQRQAQLWMEKEVAKKIKELGTDAFNADTIGLVEKTGKLAVKDSELGFSLGAHVDRYDANSLSDVVIKNARANPKAFLGVTKFGVFNSEDLGNALVAGIKKIDEATGDTVIQTAKLARNIYFYSKTAKQGVIPAFQLRKVMPEGMDVLESAIEVTIKTDRKLGQKESQWVADYLANPHLQEKSVRFEGPIGKLKANKTSVNLEAVHRYDELFGSKTTPFDRPYITTPQLYTDKIEKVKPGYTRLYKGISDTVKHEEAFSGVDYPLPKGVKGKHYTTDLEDAEYYKRVYDKKNKDAYINYIDIPTNKLKEIHHVQLDEYIVDLQKVNRPYQSVIEQADTSIPGAVIHPHAEGHMIGNVEAASAQTASMNPSLAPIYSKGRLDKVGEYAPRSNPQPITDAQFLNAAYYYSKYLPKKGEILEAGHLPKLQALVSRFAEETVQKNWVPIQMGKGKDAIKINNYQQALEELNRIKTKELQAGLDEGFSYIQLTGQTNVPYNTIEEFINNGRRFVIGSKAGTSIYTDIGNLGKYEKAKAIKVIGNSPMRGAMEEVRVSAYLDELTLKNTHQELGNIALRTIQSQGPELTNMISDVFSSKMMKKLEEELPKVLTIRENKNVLFNSADHALRSIGELGEHITTLAHNFNHNVNKILERNKRALEGSMASVKANPESASQFALLRQAVHGHSIEEAKNFRFDPARGVVITKEATENTAEELLKYQGREQVIQMDKNVNEFMQNYMPVMQESLSVHKAAVRMQGKTPGTGAGVWFPYDPVNEQFVGYLIPKGRMQDMELITANSASELEKMVIKLTGTHGSSHEIVTRANARDYWNELNRFAELDTLKQADISMPKSGLVSGVAIPGDYEVSRFMQSLTNDTWTKYRSLFRAVNSPLFDQLQFMANQSDAFAKSSAGYLAQKVQNKASNPELVYNMLLGRSMMKKTPIMDMANNATNVMLNTGINATTKAWRGFKRQTKGHFTGASAEKAFLEFSEEMKKANMPVVYDKAIEYMQALNKGAKLNNAPHKIAATQSILVTANLRFAELAHAMVTISSIPVIMAGELKHQRYPFRYMIDAVKMSMGKGVKGIDSELAQSIREYGRKAGHTTGIIAEVDNLMADLGTNSKWLEKNEKIINFMSKPSDFAERASREYAYMLGYRIAKSKWPQASHDLLLSHSAAFVKRTMGNYSTKQKPTLFQGSFGQMVGLYQTFMLTMGQNVYRYAEAGDKAAVAALVGSQAGMFGMESLPFFQDFNQMIGEYVSDDHSDPRTVAYRVFGNTEEKSVARAEFMLFGFPSTVLGSGFYTRGQLAPRSPLNVSGSEGIIFKPAIMDAMIQAYNTVWDTAANLKAVANSDGTIGDFGEAALQGAAAQSLWRPGARVAEIAMGKSFDRKGELISRGDEVYEPSAILSRLLSTRPLREQAMRNLKYQSSYYEGVDRDHRAKVIKQVRRLASDGYDIQNVDKLYLQYMEKGGSNTGWGTIMKTAYQASGTDYSERLAEYAKKNPAIVEIAEMYSH